MSARAHTMTFPTTLAVSEFLRLDIFSIWNFVLTLMTLAGGGYFILRSHRNALVKELRETAKDWEGMYRQKEVELANVSTELKELKAYSHKAIHDMREELQMMMNSNVRLMLELKGKETELEAVRGEVRALRVQVQHIEHENGGA